VLIAANQQTGHQSHRWQTAGDLKAVASTYSAIRRSGEVADRPRTVNLPALLTLLTLTIKGLSVCGPRERGKV
jgi:hypothetical protein